MPSYTVTNVIVGVASAFTAPAGTAQPADTVAYGTDWPTPWVPIGATEEGVTFAVGTDTNDVTIEEQAVPVAVNVTAKNVRVQAGLAEETVENMKLAYGGGSIVTTAAATGVIGKKVLTLSDTLDELAVGFDGKNKDGFFTRIYIPRAVSVADASTAFRRAANNRSYPLELRAICRTDQIVITSKTAAALP